MAVVKAALLAVDRIGERAILVVNAVLGALVVLAHGGALIVVLRRPLALVTPESDVFVRHVGPFTIPVAALVVIGSVLGLLARHPPRLLLQAQAVVVAVAGGASLAWAAGPAIRGLPEGGFGWGPGLLTAWVAYGAYLAVRFFAPPGSKARSRAACAPLLAAALAAPVDVAVFVRLIARLLQTQ